jgi:type III pantothenate kinase
MSRLLAVNVGNTRTTLGLHDGNEWVESWRVATKVARTADELWVIYRQFMSASSLGDGLNAVSISSVVPGLTRAYCQMAEHRLGVRPFVVTAETVRTLQVDYDPPGSVGADRLCGAVAGFAKYGGPLILVDLGTATVFDVITADAHYRGGLIVPGVMTAMESLHEIAALLPRVELRFPEEIIGRNTEASIQSGVLNGTVEMVDGIVRRLRQELNAETRVVATGGFAELIASRSKTIQHVEPNLVLEGIRLITAQQ